MRLPGGSRRAAWSRACPAQSVSFLCLPPRSRANRSEGASTVRNGSAQTRPAQGIGAKSESDTQRRPLAFTKCPWLERTASR